jgi:hypothetical protein
MIWSLPQVAMEMYLVATPNGFFALIIIAAAHVNSAWGPERAHGSWFCPPADAVTTKLLKHIFVLIVG